MCPACVIGAVFVAQLFALGRWFRRVVLKKPVKDDEVYWSPNSVLTPKMQSFAADRRKVAATVIVIAAEVIAAIIIFKAGGFMFIKHLWMKLQ